MSELTRAMHTPGPWRLDGRAGYGWIIGPTIAAAYGGPASGREAEGEANARLIAAAPELLAALEVVRRSAAWSNLSLETQSLICAAIAKAEGR